MSEVQAEDAACPITTSVGKARYDEQEGCTAMMAGEEGNGHVVMRKKPSKQKMNPKSIRSASGAQSPRSRTPKKRAKRKKKRSPRCCLRGEKRLISKCLCHPDRTHRIQGQKREQGTFAGRAVLRPTMRTCAACLAMPPLRIDVKVDCSAEGDECHEGSLKSSKEKTRQEQMPTRSSYASSDWVMTHARIRRSSR